MSENPWHHGSMSRKCAEYLLAGSSEGTFLVRGNTTFPGEHVLSVSHTGNILHYRIMLATDPVTKHQAFTLDYEEFFSTVTDLIDHYQDSADGLCTKLGRGILKPPLPDADNFETRFLQPHQVEAIEKLIWRKLRFGRNKIHSALRQSLFDSDTLHQYA